MKSLALPFHQNLTHEAVSSEVRDHGDEPSILVCLDTLPFLHFSISAPTLTYHDARNRRDVSRELREPTQLRARSMLDFR